jgi:hypothetical protein
MSNTQLIACVSGQIGKTPNDFYIDEYLILRQLYISRIPAKESKKQNKLPESRLPATPIIFV